MYNAAKPLYSTLLSSLTFYMLCLGFNVSTAVALLIADNNLVGLILGGVCTLVVGALFVEALLRPALFSDSRALDRRYILQFYIGTLSLAAAEIMFTHYPAITLLPIFFYKFYSDFYKAVPCKTLYRVGMAMLAVGVLGVPMHILFNISQVSTPVFILWLSAVSGTFLTMCADSRIPKLVQESTALEVTKGVHSSILSACARTVLHSLNAVICNMGNAHCLSNTPRVCAKDNISRMMTIVDICKEGPMDLRDILHFVASSHCYLDVQVVGWSDSTVDSDKSALLTVIDFLMQISSKSALRHNIKKPYAWVTIMPGQFVFMDKNGGCADLYEDGNLQELKHILSSDTFCSLFGLDIDIDCSNTDPAGTGIKATVKYA